VLTPSQSVRYSRQLILPEIGSEGQARLARARVAVVGLGGLGSPAALYLAAAGVGTLGLVDYDDVELANLHRQILHGTSRIGQLKVASAAERLADLNPEIRLEPIAETLTSKLAEELFDRFDLILDGTDNFPARYAINEAATRAGKPYVFGSIARFEGQVTVFGAPDGPCYRCLFFEPPPEGLIPNCADAGVLGVLPGVIGTLQAVEAIKLVVGIGTPLVGRLLSYDALAATFREWQLVREPACPSCGPTEFRRPPTGGDGCDSAALSFEIDGGELANLADVQLVDVRERWEWEIGHLPGAHHLPLGILGGATDRLDRNRPVVTVCHKGSRSLQACLVLRAGGFDARSLRGGLDAWARLVDPGFPRY